MDIREEGGERGEVEEVGGVEVEKMDEKYEDNELLVGDETDFSV